MIAALDLAASQPAATERQLRQSLSAAGLSTGPAGPVLLLELARLWQLAVPEVLDPPTDIRLSVARLAKQVRAAGIFASPSVPAGQAPPLRAAGIRDTQEWLVAVDDRTSQLARPVRRQLAAVGPLTDDALAVGARRERPSLAGLTSPALLTWAQAQPDLTVDGNVITLTGEPERWMRGTDPCVLALFSNADAVVPRSAILTALVEHGSGLPSAEVWLVRCSWLRRTDHARGRHTLASKQPATF